MSELKQTDLSKRLRQTIERGIDANGMRTLLAKAADEIERYYTGMLNWKATAESQSTQPEATKPAQDESDEDTWRRLALQFDGHRMMALSHLRAMLQDAQKHKPLAEEFLKAPPLDGEVILAQRVASLAPAQDLSAAILVLPLPGGSAASTFDPKEHVYSAWQMRELLKAAAALASPADALVAGDRVDAERYRYIRDTATLDNAVWEALEGYGMTNGAGELLEDEYRAGMDRAIDRAIQAQKDGHAE